jgi:hypothetical protein
MALAGLTTTQSIAGLAVALVCSACTLTQRGAVGMATHEHRRTFLKGCPTAPVSDITDEETFGFRISLLPMCCPPPPGKELLCDAHYEYYVSKVSGAVSRYWPPR